MKNRKIQELKPYKQGQFIRTPELGDRIDWDKEYPVFSFHYTDSKYYISKCEKQDKLSFVTKIKTYKPIHLG